MSAKAVFSPDAPNPPPFLSQAISLANLVFCSGQVAINPKTGVLVRGTVRDRTKQILLNLGAVLDAAGSGLDSIVKANIYLTNIQDFAEVNEVYVSFFPGLKPVSIVEPG
ncbi:hypothetical protein NCS57_01087500 [Fusarium keratoplasticum]|uniref:Uncharacterized protein n=1 Tax=Fusarium keratoplasticum TaxID=1328300 RepID=A0ACC0QR38_9HYPO|nr:hypothetical protein NCS57_01087500 [Fusarium keratoplasticum]KAI8661081.1 hypothetical protein NCS57_01087500 [Fusarium keratoplasticum]KAI8662088.1 hypothetical protein NCS55_01081400 [Fusarium keratoplasticum]